MKITGVLVKALAETSLVMARDAFSKLIFSSLTSRTRAEDSEVTGTGSVCRTLG